MQVVLAAGFLSLAWLLQLHLVFPLEQALRPENSNVDAFSFVFLPHGSKVLVAMFLMTWSLPVILIVSFVAGLMFGLILHTHFWEQFSDYHRNHADLAV